MASKSKVSKSTKKVLTYLRKRGDTPVRWADACKILKMSSRELGVVVTDLLAKGVITESPQFTYHVV